MDVSIILVNYNTCEMTSRCIDSIYLHTKNCSFEVILIDNNSSDQSKSVFEKDKRIAYYYQDSNLGFGRANNIGFQKASGKYFFCLNTDTLLVEDSISQMFREMEHRGLKIMGVKLVDEKNIMIHSYSPFLPSIWWEMDINVYVFSVFIAIWYRILSRLHPVFPVGYITGADLMLSSTIVKQYGGYDPDFFMYFEEAEMQRRYKKQGYKAYFYQNTRIIHLEGKSNTIRESREKMYYASRNLYYQKHFSAIYKKTADIILLLSLKYRSLYYSLLKMRKKSDFFLLKYKIAKSLA